MENQTTIQNQNPTCNEENSQGTQQSGNTQLEIRIKKDADHLLNWLTGTANSFVNAIHKLADQSEDKEKFLTYVTERVISNIEEMTAIIEFYDKRHEAERQALLQKQKEEGNGDDDSNPSEHDDYEPKEESMSENINIEELAKFFHKTISLILATNMEQLESMRLALKSRKVVAKDDEEFGQFVRDFVMYRMARSRYMLTSQRAAYIICIIIALGDYDYEEMGSHAEYIKEINDQMSAAACMIISKDYEDKKLREQEFLDALKDYRDEDED